MTRNVYSPTAVGLALPDVVPLTLGGTGGATPIAATTNLDVVSQSEKNAPNGVAALDGSGNLNTSNFPIDIDGPTGVTINQSATYQITNFDFTKPNVVTATIGTVSRVGSVVTYTAPGTVGVGGFSIDGKAFDITIDPVHVTTPSIIAPVNGYTAVTRTPTSTSSAFAVSGSTDTHLSSSWQIATDSAFTNIVQSSIDSTTNKTSWTLVQLAANTQYYIRCRHKGTVLGYSAWSIANSFTTGS